MADALSAALALWMLYLAFEPSVRRLWPERIISWARLLAGRFRDPLVGRDVLVGCLLGIGASLASYMAELATRRFGENSDGSPWLPFSMLRGNIIGTLEHFIYDIWHCLFVSMTFMVLLLGLRLLLRREGPAICILWIILTLGFSSVTPPVALHLAIVSVCAGLLVFTWTRFGSLAGAVAYLTRHLCLQYPLTLDTTAWYSGSALFAILVIVGLSLYGFSLTVAGSTRLNAPPHVF